MTEQEFLQRFDSGDKLHGLVVDLIYKEVKGIMGSNN